MLPALWLSPHLCNGLSDTADLVEVGEHLQDLGASKCEVLQLVWKYTIRFKTHNAELHIFR